MIITANMLDVSRTFPLGTTPFTEGHATLHVTFKGVTKLYPLTITAEVTDTTGPILSVTDVEFSDDGFHKLEFKTENVLDQDTLATVTTVDKQSVRKVTVVDSLMFT